MVEVSRNLDIVHKSLKTWVALYDAGTFKASIDLAKLPPHKLRIRELECEFAIAREERDIKKAKTLLRRVHFSQSIARSA